MLQEGKKIRNFRCISSTSYRILNAKYYVMPYNAIYLQNTLTITKKGHVALMRSNVVL